MSLSEEVYALRTCGERGCNCYKFVEPARLVRRLELAFEMLCERYNEKPDIWLNKAKEKEPQ